MTNLNTCGKTKPKVSPGRAYAPFKFQLNLACHVGFDGPLYPYPASVNVNELKLVKTSDSSFGVTSERNTNSSKYNLKTNIDSVGNFQK